MDRLIIIAMLVLSTSSAVAQTQISAKDAAKHLGELVTICDKIYSTKLISGSNMILLNLGGFYPNQLLTVIIRNSDRAKFPGKQSLI